MLLAVPVAPRVMAAEAVGEATEGNREKTTPPAPAATVLPPAKVEVRVPVAPEEVRVCRKTCTDMFNVLATFAESSSCSSVIPVGVLAVQAVEVAAFVE